MSTKKLQDFSDSLIEKIFFRFIPNSIEPNYFTYGRILSVPLIFYLMSEGLSVWAFVAFVLSVSTDFIDGALARKRNQITELGKVLDPIADKLLIVTVLYFIGSEYLIIKIFIAIIIFEIIAVLLSVALSNKLGKPLGANIFGKIKMILQSFSIISFLLGAILNNNLLINLALYMLSAALLFAFLAGVMVTVLKFDKLRELKKKINL